MLPAENGRREEKGHWSPTQELKVQLCSEIEQSSKTEHSFKMIILTTYVSTHVPDLLRTDGEVMVSWITLKDGLLGHSRARKRRTFFIFTGGGLWLVLKAIQDYFQNFTCRNWSDGVHKPNLTQMNSTQLRSDLQTGF